MRFVRAVFRCVRMRRLSDLSISRCTICSYRHPMLSFPFFFLFCFFCREFCSANKDRTDQTAKKKLHQRPSIQSAPILLCPPIKRFKKNGGFSVSIFQSRSLFVRECFPPDKKKKKEKRRNNNNNLSNCL